VRRAVVLGGGQKLREEDEQDHLSRPPRVRARPAARSEGDDEQRLGHGRHRHLRRSYQRVADAFLRSRKVGSLECRAWETYYRRRWAAFLIASVGLVRAAFGMNWPRTLVGAWLVLRANQRWAPHPDNDPDAARAPMASFYRLVRASEGLSLETRRR
jgi:hypothetical protein